MSFFLEAPERTDDLHVRIEARNCPAGRDNVCFVFLLFRQRYLKNEQMPIK